VLEAPDEIIASREWNVTWDGRGPDEREGAQNEMAGPYRVRPLRVEVKGAAALTTGQSE